MWQTDKMAYIASNIIEITRKGVIEANSWSISWLSVKKLAQMLMLKLKSRYESVFGMSDACVRERRHASHSISEKLCDKDALSAGWISYTHETSRVLLIQTTTTFAFWVADYMNTWQVSSSSSRDR